MSSKKSKSPSQSGLASLLNLPGIKYLNETDSELKKVTWPTRQQVIKLSTIVVAVSFAIGLYLGALDLAFTYIIGMILKF